MNELLGLFGYEKVDESTKDSIQLSNNLSGPSKSKSDRSSLPVGGIFDHLSY